MKFYIKQGLMVGGNHIFYGLVFHKYIALGFVISVKKSNPFITK